ncbi:unnamed protein product [[Candida] boidinii]|nr:unnamed protein product [[Candida] boidinii]
MFTQEELNQLNITSLDRLTNPVEFSFHLNQTITLYWNNIKELTNNNNELLVIKFLKFLQNWKNEEFENILISHLKRFVIPTILLEYDFSLKLMIKLIIENFLKITPIIELLTNCNKSNENSIINISNTQYNHHNSNNNGVDDDIYSISIIEKLSIDLLFNNDFNINDHNLKLNEFELNYFKFKRSFYKKNNFNNYLNLLMNCIKIEIGINDKNSRLSKDNKSNSTNSNDKVSNMKFISDHVHQHNIHSSNGGVGVVGGVHHSNSISLHHRTSSMLLSVNNNDGSALPVPVSVQNSESMTTPSNDAVVLDDDPMSGLQGLAETGSVNIDSLAVGEEVSMVVDTPQLVGNDVDIMEDDDNKKRLDNNNSVFDDDDDDDDNNGGLSNSSINKFIN